MNLTEYIDSQRQEHLNDLYEFLKIPSVSAQSEHKPDIERAAKWVASRLTRRRPRKCRNRAHENAPARLWGIAARAGQADHSFLRAL